MERSPYFPSSESTSHQSVLHQPHILCGRHDHLPLSGFPLDNTMDHDHHHGLLCATREDVWGGKDLEGVVNNNDSKPFVKIDEKTIQHFSHDHHLRFHENENYYSFKSKFCQACCLQLVVSESFYGCMECDFVLHEACTCLPLKKHHPLHKHPLILHSFPLNPNFEAYVSGMFACDGCDQLNCGFQYKCGEKDCDFQLDVRCASLTNPSIHENYHLRDHPLFFSRTRGICTCCKSSKCSPYLLECKKCNFLLGLKCATLPSVAQYKHNRHRLMLCYDKEITKNLQYWCQKCELEIDEKAWFYSCDSFKVSLHVKCLLGTDIYMKPHHTIDINEEEVRIVQNDGSSQAFCYVCGRRCVDTLIFMWKDRYSCSFLCIVTFFL